MALLLPILIALGNGGLPDRPTAATKLSTDELHHHEVLRIDRDFGMDKWELALDGWLPRDATATIADVRLWWVNVQDGDRRKPFSNHLRRYIQFDYQRSEGGALSVRMAGDGKEYAFVVELGPGGVPVVLAEVTRSDGTLVPRCRCSRGRLIARRFLGLPIGVAALQVTCTDEGGATHDGTVTARAIEAGPAYEPE